MEREMQLRSGIGATGTKLLCRILRILQQHDHAVPRLFVCLHVQSHKCCFFVGGSSRLRFPSPDVCRSVSHLRARSFYFVTQFGIRPYSCYVLSLCSFQEWGNVLLLHTCRVMAGVIWFAFLVLHLLLIRFTSSNMCRISNSVMKRH